MNRTYLMNRLYSFLFVFTMLLTLTVGRVCAQTPTVLSVIVADNVYIPGNDINIIVNFNIPVNIIQGSRKPFIQMTVGTNGTWEVPWDGFGNGSSTLVFTQTMSGSGVDLDGINLDTGINPWDGTINGENGIIPLSNNFFPNATYDGDPPLIQGATMAADNSYIDVIFNEPIFANPDGTGAVSLSHFGFGGSTATFDSPEATLTLPDYSPLVAGTNVIRFTLNYNPPPTGSETIYIHIADGFNIYDAAGNISSSGPAPSTGAIALNDLIPPAAPATPDLATASDLGFSNSDDITNNNTPTITGNAEIGSTVNLFSNLVGGSIGSATADGSGMYSIVTSTLGDGTHTITATATDAGGNESDASIGLPITIDTQVPDIGPISFVVNSGTGGQHEIFEWTFTEPVTNIFDGTGTSLADFSMLGFTLTPIGGEVAIGTQNYTQSTNNGALESSANNSQWTIGTKINYNAGNIYDVAGNLMADFNNRGAGDAVAPTITPDVMTLALNGTGEETITFTLSEELNLPEGLVDGFTTSSGPPASVVYSGKGTTNTITMASGSDDFWSEATTVTYTPGGNVKDLSGNEMAAVIDHAVFIDCSSPPTISGSVTNEILCFGLTDGEITAVGADGIGGYTYVLNEDTGNTTGNASGIYTGLVPGSYTVTVTDDNGCEATTGAIALNEPTLLSLSTTGDILLSCMGDTNGSGSFIAAGGTPPYVFNVDTNTTGAIFSSLSTSPLDFSSAGVGAITVTVTDGNGCFTTNNVNLTEPAAVTPPTGNGIQNFCANDGPTIADFVVSGTVIQWYATPSGGSSLLTSTSLVDGSTFYASQTVGGCESPTRLQVAASVSINPTINIGAITQPTCNTPTGSVNLTGLPAGPWTINPGAIAGSGASFTLTGLTAGITHNITVTENTTSCTSALSGDIIIDAIPSAPVITELITPNTSCAVGNGILEITTIDGGAASLATHTVNWSIGNSAKATPDLTNNLTYGSLVTGNYTVEVIENATGCLTTNTYFVPDNLSTATFTTSQLNFTNCLSPNGEIMLDNITGTGPFTITINGGVEGQVANVSGYDFGSSGAFTAFNLNPDSYSVVVTDESTSCPSSPSLAVVEDMSVSPAITPSITPNTSCAGGNGQLEITTIDGGTASLATHTVNWSIGNSAKVSPDLANNLVYGSLIAGNYTVEVIENATGCSTTNTYFVSENIITPTFLTSSTDFTNCLSPNGEIMLDNITGTGPFTITINGGVEGQVANVSGYDFGSSGAFTAFNLNPDSYSVVVTDEATSCPSSPSLVVVEDMSVSPAITPSITPNTLCTGGNGQLEISINGGVGSISTHTVNWSIGTSAKPTPDFDGSLTYSGLIAGDYTVEVIEIATGCSAISTNTVADNLPTVSVDGYNSTDNSSCGTPNGQIDINSVSGGTGPYNYSIDNGSTYVTDQLFPGLSSGSYLVVVQDANGCVSVPFSVNLIDLSATPTIAIGTTTNPTSAGGTDGSIVLNFTNVPDGTHTLNYAGGSFSNVTVATNSATVNNLSAGSYDNITITVSECTSIDGVNALLEDPAITEIVINDTQITNISCNSPSGSIEVIQVTPGTVSDYTYALYDAAGTNLISSTYPFAGLSAGNYNIRATDPNSSVESVNFLVTIEDLQVSITGSISGDATICDGQSTPIAVTFDNGTGPYEVVANNGVGTKTGLTNGSNTFDVSPSSTTTYSVTSITDSNGCTGTIAGSVTITVLPIPTTASVGANQSICESTIANLGGNIPTIGTGVWSTSGSATITDPTNPTSGVTGLVDGENTFTWTISNQCQNSAADIIITKLSIPSSGSIAESGGRTTLCPSEAGVTFNTTATGATSYLWTFPAGFNASSFTTSTGSITVDMVNVASGSASVQVVASNDCGELAATPLNLTITTAPDVSINVSERRYALLPIEFSFNSNISPSTIAWNFGDGNSSTDDAPRYTYATPGTYKVSVTLEDGGGCNAYNELEIEVIEAAAISIKNAVTPNGDGKNDFLTVEGILDYLNNTVTLLDRYGNKIKEIEGYQNDWDMTTGGSTLPAGNYVCIVKLHDLNVTETRTITIVK